MPTPFIWDPDLKQLYDSKYGTQTLTGPADNFSKNFHRGLTFTPGNSQTLTLAPTHGFMEWGKGPNGDDQEMYLNFNSGTLLIDGSKNVTSDLPADIFFHIGNQEGYGETFITGTGDASLRLRDFSQIWNGTVGNAMYELMDNFSFDVESSVGFQTSASMGLKDNASHSVFSENINMNAAFLLLHGHSSARYTTSSSNQTIQLTYGTKMNAFDSSFLYLKSINLGITGEGNSIGVGDNAHAVIATEQWMWDDSSAQLSFKILGKSKAAQIKFIGKPFYFSQESVFFPKGLFDFTVSKAGNDNQGKMILPVTSTADVDSLFKRQLVTINSQPASKDMFKTILDSGTLILALK